MLQKMPVAKKESFSPEADSTRAFRRALSSFGTGVAIVTCCDDTGPLSIAANSFASVSLNPPLVLWSPAKESGRHNAFVAAKSFSINVLREEQLNLCVQASSGGRNFELGQWVEDSRGVPILPTALARFDCTQHSTHEAGDHTIIIGQVERVTCQEGDPLLFVQSHYGGFSKAL